jgi:hypothetical protein
MIAPFGSVHVAPEQVKNASGETVHDPPMYFAEPYSDENATALTTETEPPDVAL